MRTSLAALAVCLLFGAVVGQSPPPAVLPPSVVPAGHASAGDGPRHATAAITQPHPLQEARSLLARRSVEWLFRANQVSGRFLPGLTADATGPLEDNGFAAQAQCAAALALGAKFFNDERMAVRARQAVLALLAQTATDPHEAQLRYPEAGDGLTGAGMLLWAIHELPQPATNLLDQGEQLARYIATQQRADGTLTDARQQSDPLVAQTAQGMALFALMKSQALRPAPWKVEVLRRAMTPVQAAWAARPSVALALWHSSAFAEAYLLSGDRNRDSGYGQLALVMCDQVALAELPPRGESAWAMRALADGIRVTRQMPDIERHGRYQAALDRGCLLLDALQVTSANSQHLPLPLRQTVVGGLRTSPDDASVRGENTAGAVAAVVQYLMTHR